VTRAPAGRAVTAESLGAWLLKVDPLERSDFVSLETRCVRPSYRTDLVRAGQPVLVWVSGSDPRRPGGLRAAGLTTGEVGPHGAELALPLRVRPVRPPVTRADLLAEPDLRDLEVLRMPAGSNPSYLDRAQYAALLAAFPQVVG
jgi:hypothetical protein